jgi:chitin synthase
LPTALEKFLKGLKETRYYTFIYVSVWKIACFFFIMLVVTSIEYDSEDAVANLFDMFEATYSQRNINITEVRKMFTKTGKALLCLKVQQKLGRQYYVERG